MGPRSRVLGRLPADAGGALPSQVVSGAGSGDGEHLRRSGRPQCGHKRPRGLQAEGGWTHTEGRSGGDGQGRDAGSLPQRLEEARRAFSPEGPEQVVLGPRGSWGGKRWGPRQEGERWHGRQDKALWGFRGACLGQKGTRGPAGKGNQGSTGSQEDLPEDPRGACRLLAVAPCPSAPVLCPGPTTCPAPLPPPPPRPKTGKEAPSWMWDFLRTYHVS